ncbi:glycerol-3-phosphate 1-O-acyltransferase PlsY [Pelagibacteraceae bacterium]|nr:glycerol-3-phosphate 1-O-acyltransferase PlsY [Pelagibacteraceae bacterium]
MNIDILLVFFYSYFLGSIPFGLILTKLFLREDIRKIGSGNIGATNVLRTGKKFLAIMTLLLDVIKGFLTVYATSIYFNDFVYLAALICFIGHIYPVWLKFKGGKGVAVYLGTIIFISFKCAVIFGLVWIITLFIYKYSSLSSIISALFVFTYSVFLNNFSLSLYVIIAFIIMIYTHKENIIRLRNKTENKIKF